MSCGEVATVNTSTRAFAVSIALPPACRSAHRCRPVSPWSSRVEGAPAPPGMESPTREVVSEADARAVFDERVKWQVKQFPQSALEGVEVR